MTRRSPRPRLEHILDACQNISDFVARKSFTEYADDRMLRSAVERQFMIIGEALRAAESIEPAIAQEVTEFREAIDFRNVLVHGYSTVYHEGVWDIIHNHLPRLRREIETVLGRY